MGKATAKVRNDDNAARSARRDSSRRILSSRRIDYSRSDRTETSAAGELGRLSESGFAAVAGMREAFDRSTKNGGRSDLAILIGAFILAGSIAVTLILALSINARANRLLSNDATRATAGGIIIDRVEGKIDRIEKKVDALTTTTTTTTTKPARQAPATTRPATTTTRPTVTTTTTTTTIPPVPTTRRPCVLALGDICLL